MLIQAHARQEAFGRAKDLLRAITSLNAQRERRERDAETRALVHPYDSLQGRTRVTTTTDFAVTRFHASAAGPSAMDLARVEAERQAVAQQQAVADADRRQRAVAARGAAASTRVDALRTAASLTTGDLRQAVRADRAQKLERRAAESQRAGQDAGRAARLRREFDAAFPVLHEMTRADAVRSARSRAGRRARRERRPVRRERDAAAAAFSPDDVADRHRPAVVTPALIADLQRRVAEPDRPTTPEARSVTFDVSPPRRPAAPSSSSPEAAAATVHSIPQVVADTGVVERFPAPQQRQPPGDVVGRPPADVVEGLQQAEEQGYEHQAEDQRHEQQAKEGRESPPDAVGVPPLEAYLPEAALATDVVSVAEAPVAFDEPGPEAALATDVVSVADAPDAFDEPEVPVKAPSLDEEDVDEARLSALLESVEPLPADAALAALAFGSSDDLDDLDRRAEALLRSHIPTTPQLLSMRSAPLPTPMSLDDASAFAQTIDETLDFLRRSRVELDESRAALERGSADAGDNNTASPPSSSTTPTPVTESTTSSSSSSLQEQFRTNRVLIERIERRRQQLLQRRASRP